MLALSMFAQFPSFGAESRATSSTTPQEWTLFPSSAPLRIRTDFEGWWSFLLFSANLGAELHFRFIFGFARQNFHLSDLFAGFNFCSTPEIGANFGAQNWPYLQFVRAIAKMLKPNFFTYASGDC